MNPIALAPTLPAPGVRPPRIEVREAVYAADGAKIASRFHLELPEDQAHRYVQAHAVHVGKFPEYETADRKRFELRLLAGGPGGLTEKSAPTGGLLVDTADTEAAALEAITLHNRLWRDVADQALEHWTIVDRATGVARSALVASAGIAWPPDLTDWLVAQSTKTPPQPTAPPELVLWAPPAEIETVAAESPVAEVAVLEEDPVIETADPIGDETV